MIHIYDAATLAAAFASDLAPDLRLLLTDRIDAIGPVLAAQTEWLVIGPGDSEAEIIAAIGFSPLVDPIDRIRYGEDGFHPAWDWVLDHNTWYELSVSFGGGFALMILIEKHAGVMAELLRMCGQYTTMPI